MDAKCNMLNVTPDSLTDTDCWGPAVKRVKAEPASLLCADCVEWWEADGGYGELEPLPGDEDAS